MKKISAIMAALFSAVLAAACFVGCSEEKVEINTPHTVGYFSGYRVVLSRFARPGVDYPDVVVDYTVDDVYIATLPNPSWDYVVHESEDERAYLKDAFSYGIITHDDLIAIAESEREYFKNGQVGDGTHNGSQASPDHKNCEALIETSIYANIFDCQDFIAICTSSEGFKQECISHGFDFFDSADSSQNMYAEECGKLVRQLAADEFEDYALVVCAFYLPLYAGQHQIEDVEVQDGQLTMYVRRPSSNAADDVISYAFLIAQVESSVVNGVEHAEHVFC